MKIIGFKNVFVGVMTAYAFSGALAFSVELEKPTANLTEHYVTDAGWVKTFDPGASKATAGWTNGMLMAKFQGVAEGSEPLMQSAILMGLTNSSDGRFSGDFSKIVSVSVDVQVINAPTLIFYFQSTRGIVWKRIIDGLPANTPAGEWVNVTIPLDQSSWSHTGSWAMPLGTNLVSQANFASDKASVCQFGFEVQRNSGGGGTANNQVNVDNVKLIGPWGQPLINDAVPLAWLMEHNLSEVDADGYMDVASMLFGTNPNNSNAVFTVDIGRDSQGKPVVKWKDSKFVVFDLLESTDLNAPFSPVSGAEGIVGTGSGREVQVDNATPGAHFFKVKVHPAQ